MVTVVTGKRPKTRQKSYGLFLSFLLPFEERDNQIDYTIKLKRIPKEAELIIDQDSDQNGLLYKWTWYETEIE